MKKLVALILVALMALSGFALAESKELSMYAALTEDELPFYFAAFEEATGIHVNYTRLSAGEMISRLIAEKDNPQVSVVFGGGSEGIITAQKQGLLYPYTPNGIENIPEQYVVSEYWTPFYLAILCFAVNNEWFEENGVDYPATWEDLLDPVYKDMVITAHPSTSGVASNILTSMVQLKGEDEAFEYFRQLKEIVPYFSKASSSAPSMVALGEAAVGLTVDSDTLKYMNQGYDMDFVFPDPTFVDVGAMAIVANGPEDELENAKAFLDFMISVEGQNLFISSGSTRMPLNVNADISEGLKPLSSANVFLADRELAGADRARLIEKFIAEVDDASALQ
ncbi:MAG: ABC transporter substrate-binding protein [Clostridia bacterium]|nr:ABC transporter substrate-binding protein [Clostridia bacterium]